MMARRKILVADDDPRVRRLVTITVGKDFEVFEAGNGEEALAVAAKNIPESALLDVNMPRMDGLQACRGLRANPALVGLRIMMLTGLGSDEDRAKGIAAGTNDYMIKPFSPRALLDKLNELLGTIS